MAKGTKRASPGAEDEKSALQSVELSDEDAKKLQGIQRELARAELVIERQAQALLRPVYEKRREIVKAIPSFWRVALLNNSVISYHAQHGADLTALNYLEDMWVVKSADEHRCFTIEFYFKENQFFHDTVLKKEFKFVSPPAAKDEKPDEYGITESSLDFSWERDVELSVTKINWKDADKALTKLYPREAGDSEDDIPAEPGSFFNFFECKADPSDVGLAIANEIFPEAIEYFLGNISSESDSEDSEDDDDDDAEEIDLEKPRNKKRKV
ncbi:hypothetical protein K443DRAFT_675108 [Laccaria amethystina LaAM-08-1]|uniref:Nucleosome assembly protein n=1 Tax=Laccaria amethystina LaAM-08-1 TaxID=1095629 RepID=A0A0C9XVE4_9AGAR|nr:hypothetical protein K443DRAFT_675108 [Laccaria amethystina LaAM-08-1]